MDMRVIGRCDPCPSRWAYLLGQLGGEKNDHAALRAVVRGEQPLDRIIATIIEAPAVERVNPPRISLTSADLADGMMNLKNDPSALSEWAGFILASYELFDFEDEQSECWDRLLTCIWDLALGGQLGNSAIALAGAVRGRQSWASGH